MTVYLVSKEEGDFGGIFRVLQYGLNDLQHGCDAWRREEGEERGGGGEGEGRVRGG